MKNHWAILGAIGVVSLVLCIISLATPGWSKVGILSTGLWQTCFGFTCQEWEVVPDYLLATRITLIFAVILLAAASALSLKAVFSDSWINLGIAVCFGGAAIGIVVALSVFTKHYVTKNAWSYSYILGWISFVMNLFLCFASGHIAKRSVPVTYNS